MAIEGDDIIVDVNFTDDLNVDNNSSNESVWYSLFYQCVRCMSGCCLIKRICCKKEEISYYGNNAIEDFGEGTNGFNTVALFPSSKSSSENSDMCVTTLQSSVMVHLPNSTERLTVNVDSENTSNLDELFTSNEKNEDNEVENINKVKDDVVFSGTWINEVLRSLIEGTENDWVWSLDLHERLSILLMQLVNNEVKLFLVKSNFLSIAKIILKACDQSWMNGILIDIIINICCNDKAIDFVGRDKELVIVILNHFKYRGDIVIPGKVLELLLKIVDRIRRDPRSPWANHFVNNEILGTNIIGILNNIINDDVLMAERLLRLITGIISLPNFSYKLLSYKVNELISGLLTCFIQVIPDKEEGSGYFFEESAFIKYWLILIINIRRRIFIDYKGRTFLLLLDIIYKILKSYNNTYLIDPEIINVIEISQNLSVIYHSVTLLSMIYCGNKISRKVDRMVLNIIYHLKTIIPDFETNESLKKKLKELLEHLTQYWIRMMTKCDNAHICETLYPCEPEIRKCLLDLIRSNSNISSEMRNRIYKIENCLKSSAVYSVK